MTSWIMAQSCCMSHSDLDRDHKNLTSTSRRQFILNLKKLNKINPQGVLGINFLRGQGQPKNIMSPCTQLKYTIMQMCGIQVISSCGMRPVHINSSRVHKVPLSCTWAYDVWSTDAKWCIDMDKIFSRL